MHLEFFILISQLVVLKSELLYLQVPLLKILEQGICLAFKITGSIDCVLLTLKLV